MTITNKEEEIYFMKRQVRRGVFETNSSSTHSITMCSESEFNEFENGNMYIEKWGSELYTKKELIEKLKQAIDWRTKNFKYCGVDWDNEEEFNRVLEESDIVHMMNIGIQFQESTKLLKNPMKVKVEKK